MKTIEFIDGQSDLNVIADDASRTGEAVTVVRSGRPYVDVIPYSSDLDEERKKANKAKLFAEIDALRKTLPPTTLAEIQAAKEEGRR